MKKIILSLTTIFLFGFLITIILAFLVLATNNRNQNRTSIPKTEPTPTPVGIVKRDFIVRAAIPYWDQENAVESFKENVDVIDNISLFWYYLDGSGNIRKYEYADEDESVIDFAHENKVGVSAVLTNLPEVGTWDSKRVERILKDDESITKHVKDIKDLLLEKDFDGVTIDYESVDSSQKKQFTQFVKKLSEEVKKDGKYVEVALHPKEDFSSQRKYAYQDWGELAKYADRIYIMAYEEHYDEGEPGPPASIPWVERILNYAGNQDIGEGKLLLGIPLYGYDWDNESEDGAEGLTFEDVLKLLSDKKVSPRFDDESKTNFFEYGTHEVWYENAESFRHKLNLVFENNLEGITFWRLGGEDPKIWEILRKIKTS